MVRCGLLLLWLVSRSAGATVMPAPVVSVTLAGSGVEVSSAVVLPMKPCEAYAMLTDYDGLPKFIPGLLESHYQRIAPHRVRVHQVGEVQVFIFHMRMKSLLDMEEVPNRRIRFRQIKGDFESYRGEWEFSAIANGTRLAYKAALSFKPYVPLQLAKSILQHDVKRKFVAIAKEALARKLRGALRCAAEKP